MLRVQGCARGYSGALYGTGCARGYRGVLEVQWYRDVARWYRDALRVQGCARVQVYVAGTGVQ